MVPTARWAVIPALLVVWLGSAGSAPAAAPEVKDGAGYFKPETVKQANDMIRDIEKRYRKDLLIETFAHAPAGMEEKAKAADHRQFFHNWARKRASDSAINGIYILICKEPPYIQPEIGTETLKRDFTKANRDHLVSHLLQRFKDKKYDE